MNGVYPCCSLNDFDSCLGCQLHLEGYYPALLSLRLSYCIFDEQEVSWSDVVERVVCRSGQGSLYSLANVLERQVLAIKEQIISTSSG